MRISDWSSDVCSSDLPIRRRAVTPCPWNETGCGAGNGAFLGQCILDHRQVAIGERWRVQRGYLHRLVQPCRKALKIARHERAELGLAVLDCAIIDRIEVSRIDLARGVIERVIARRLILDRKRTR